MRILIAPDKFKGALSARDVAASIAAGLRDVLPQARIEAVPMADGGEGTAEVICDSLAGRWVTCSAHDPLGREIEARYADIAKGHLAVMEMSEAAGLQLLSPNERDVDRASTFGVGEMILDAAKQGAEQIIVGLGGSATNDGGFGTARVLGFRFFANKTNQNDKDRTPHLAPLSAPPGRDPKGQQFREHCRGLTSKVSELRKLERIDRPTNLSLPKIVAAVDVKNPLLGANGATRVFGPQKGATPETIPILEEALTQLADVVTKEFGSDFRDQPGAGAAGGLGFGLMSFCGADVRPGFDVVAESVGLESRIKEVDIVITGEGSLDRQTLEGKTAAGVARLARKFDKPVFAMVGRATNDRDVRGLFDGVYALARPGMSEAENMKRARELLRLSARALAKNLKTTPNAERRR
jgi:glycerate 2-kinase